MKNITVFIGLDGATFTILDPLMQQGVMPNLAKITNSGVKAELMSVIPPLTPPAWTSLVTGKAPGVHGIFDFFLKEKDNHNIRFATSKDVQSETIWSMVNRHGHRATVLNFPLMMPTPVLDGNIIAGGWMTPRQLRLGCSPETIYDKLKELPWFEPNEITLEMSHEVKALEGCEDNEYEDWIQFHIRRETQWTKIMTYFMETEPCKLMAIMFDGVDKIQHLCWPFISPELDVESLAPWEKRVRVSCLEYFSELDHSIGEIYKAAGDDATILFGSDHGFGAQLDTFFVNTWLEQNGYLQWADSKELEESDVATLGIGQVSRHSFAMDWKNTRAYASMPSSNGIHIVKRSNDTPNGVNESDYFVFRRQLIEDLKQIVRPDTGNPVVDHVWTREEAFDGPMMPYAPDLTLSLHDSGNMSILSSDKAVKPRKRPLGTHRPEGIFIAKGPKYQSGAMFEAISILDIAPLILDSLDLPIPTDLAGHLPEKIYQPGLLQKCPSRIEGTTIFGNNDTKSSSGKSLFDTEAETEMASRLRALGYIE